MKNTKVKYYRTAVAKNNENPQVLEGIMYIDSGKIANEKSTIQKTEALINSRVEDVKKLNYNIFNPIKKKEKFGKYADNLEKFINYANTRGSNFVKRSWTYNDLKDSFKGIVFDEKILDLALENLLRNALRGGKDEFRRFLLGVKNKTELSKTDIEDVEKKFIDKIKTDYEKTKQLSNAPIAIRNQNLVIQTTKEQNEFLPPSLKEGTKGSKNHQEKSIQKEAFRQFLIDYASTDEEIRKDYRKRLRRIVELYFYGEESLKDTLNYFDEWKNHNDRKDESKAVSITNALNGASDFCVYVLRDKQNNSEIKETDFNRTKENYRYANNVCYAKAKKFLLGNNHNDFLFENNELNLFWINRISIEVENIWENLHPRNEFKVKRGYVSEKVWKGLINFLSIKYIAVGKTVYNFAMKDLDIEESDSLNLGEIPDEYLDGISSFELERIKAEEELQRDIAVQITFGSQNFANQVLKPGTKTSDILISNLADLENAKNTLIERPLKNILQFFGGESYWKNYKEIFQFEDSVLDKKAIKFIDDLRKAIYSTRNVAFHYSTKVEDVGWSKENEKIIYKMFCIDCNQAVEELRNRIETNNLVTFFGGANTNQLMNFLYKELKERNLQIPRFNKVFVRSDFSNTIKEIGLKIPQNISNPEEVKKWYSALYFIFGEIYYNAFIFDNKWKSRMQSAIDEIKSDNYYALESFKNVFNHYQSESFPDLCQKILTEWNLHNNDSRKKYSEKEISHPHYKILLKEAIKRAFIIYLKKEKINDKWLVEYFEKSTDVEELKINPYKNLISLLEPQYSGNGNNTNSQTDNLKWYVLGRVLSPKQLNTLSNAIRSYNQYLGDVTKRAEETGNPLGSQSKRNLNNSIILSILEMCSHLNAKVSQEIKDYFENELEYENYLRKYLDFNGELKDSFRWSDSQVNEYHDGTNPIILRQVIQCKLFGGDEIVTNAVEKVSESDIKHYRDLKEKVSKIEGYNQGEKCNTESDVKLVKEYTYFKNKIELWNHLKYAEILRQIQGKMINWTYLRERDLMYFQLGFHYLCLKNKKNNLPEEYKKVIVRDRTINAAILYQFAAIYTYGLPHLIINESGYLDFCDRNSFKITSEKVMDFVDYSEYILKKSNTSKEMSESEKLLFYNAGLELFGNDSDLDQAIKLRNSIEHFHYFYDDKRSILRYLSEIFDYFFTYDVKYRKSIPDIINNVLDEYRIVLNYHFDSSQRKGDKKECASIELKEKYGISTMDISYTYGENQSVDLPAHSDEFILNVWKILNYNGEKISAVNESMIGKSKSRQKTKKEKETERTITQIEADKIYEGVITKISAMGLFVNIGFKNKISVFASKKCRIDKFKEGQKVTIKITTIDPATGVIIKR